MPVSSADVKLREKFHLLMDKLGIRHLELLWVPDASKRLSGEVKNGVLYIYEGNEERALETLKHELIDYLITSRIVKPLVDLVNLLIRSKESEIYGEKEKIVGVLSRMLA